MIYFGVYLGGPVLEETVEARNPNCLAMERLQNLCSTLGEVANSLGLSHSTREEACVGMAVRVEMARSYMQRQIKIHRLTAISESSIALLEQYFPFPTIVIHNLSASCNPSLANALRERTSLSQTLLLIAHPVVTDSDP